VVTIENRAGSGWRAHLDAAVVDGRAVEPDVLSRG
jgi:hypothetical protein